MPSPSINFLSTVCVGVLLALGPVAAADHSLEVGSAEIRVQIEDGESYGVATAEMLAWVQEAAAVVSAYYGRFPVDHLTVHIKPGRGGHIGGHAYGWKRTVSASLGPEVTAADLESDWVMTHEMVHMAFPDVSDQHQWIKEGLSVYVQRIARARAGDLSPPAVWGDLMESLPQGLPRPGDQGLDYTHTWGRTYWGGALFCLLADIKIRRQTDNRFGLQDALRAIVAGGGTLNRDWSIERAFRVGDEAVGAPVLMTLYERMKDAPYTPDLDELWQDLGVERTSPGTRLHNDAPLADVRRAIMNGPAGPA